MSDNGDKRAVKHAQPRASIIVREDSSPYVSSLIQYRYVRKKSFGSPIPQIKGGKLSLVNTSVNTDRLTVFRPYMRIWRTGFQLFRTGNGFPTKRADP